jgi:hypothetical protein
MPVMSKTLELGPAEVAPIRVIGRTRAVLAET